MNATYKITLGCKHCLGGIEIIVRHLDPICYLVIHIMADLENVVLLLFLHSFLEAIGRFERRDVVFGYDERRILTDVAGSLGGAFLYGK